MDCCRSAKRLGASEVRVIARRSRPHFKASPWELQDAEEEGVIIVENHAPTRFIVQDGVLAGMEFDVVEWSEGAGGRAESRTVDTVVIPCDAVILAIGQEAAFPWIEPDIGIELDKWGAPVVDKNTFQTTRPGVFVGGDAAWGPENIIWAVEHGHQAAISLHQYLQGRSAAERPAWGMNLVSQKMGLHEWSYGNDYDTAHRAKMRHVELVERLRNLEVEVELGFDFEQTLEEAGRCLNCDVQTHFTAPLCIECDACVDVCPVSCLTIAPNGDEDELRLRLTVPALNLRQPLYVSDELPQTQRVMVKDEDICIHCGLCAERCPTAAWDMRRSDVLIPYAGLAPGASHPPRGRSLPILANVTIFPARPAAAPVAAGAA
jgi:formate dehydrogenase beta subunit